MRKENSLNYRESKMQQLMLRCIWWQKAIQIANRAMNAQNLTFIKTQSFVKSTSSFFSLAFLFSYFRDHAANPKRKTFILIFYVAYFQTVVEHGIITHLLFKLKPKLKKHKNALWENASRCCVEEEDTWELINFSNAPHARTL